MKGIRQYIVRLFCLKPPVVRWSVGILLLAAAVVPGVGAPPKLTATEFRTVYLAKVSILATWATNSLPGTNTNLIIGVLGPDPFDGLLEKLTAHQTVGGRPIVVKMDADAETAMRCNILFIPAEQQSAWLGLRRAVGEGGIAGVLTIGEDSEFLKTGGIIRLLPEKRSCELSLSNAGAQADWLRLDPKLKRAAQIVP